MYHAIGLEYMLSEYKSLISDEKELTVLPAEKSCNVIF